MFMYFWSLVVKCINDPLTVLLTETSDLHHINVVGHHYNVHVKFPSCVVAVFVTLLTPR